MSQELIVRRHNSVWVLRDRLTGTELARGTKNEVRQAAQGVGRIVGVPRLGPVELVGHSWSGFADYCQTVAESYIFQGRLFVQDVDIWTDCVLYADHLGIGFAERIADVPLFVQGVQQLTGESITSIKGTASLAGIGESPLLGDWIKYGRFEPLRLARRFEQASRGQWNVVAELKYAKFPISGYIVTIERQAGT